MIGTTGFTKKEENLIKKFAKKIPILKAGNMSLGINLLMYLTEIASSSLGKNFLLKYLKFIINIKRTTHQVRLNVGKGIAIGKNKNFYNLIGKKYFNKKIFHMETKLILIP